jgi:rhamnulokinase
MNAAISFLAVDLGASNGRLMGCRWNGNRFTLQEMHRFPNGPVRAGSSLHWDLDKIWSEIQDGLRKFRALGGEPAGIGVDSWGVDYCLLDGDDRPLGNPYHYRDARTNGLPAALQSLMTTRELFDATGVQTMAINTVFQLASMVVHQDPELQRARTLLMIPDMFQFLLSGQEQAEYTEATTSQIFDVSNRCWSALTLTAFQLPPQIFPPVVLPGTVLGPILPAVQSSCGFVSAFPCVSVASHDTASAVAAIPGLDDSSIFLSSGTWSLMGVAASEPNLSHAFFDGGFTNEGAADGGVLLLKNMTGLWILQECVRNWEEAGQHYAWSDLEQAAQHAPAFRSFIDPATAALQAPPDMLAAVREFCSSTRQPVPQTPGEVARCVFESLSFSYRAVVESLAHITGRTLTTVRVVGGGSLNRFLCQMTADACGRQVVAGPVEAAALGNAMVQAVATGHLQSLADGRAALAQSVDLQHYAPASGSAWQDAFEQYKSVGSRGRQV